MRDIAKKPNITYSSEYKAIYQQIQNLIQYGALTRKSKKEINFSFNDNPWYRAILSKRANDFANVELKLYRRGGRKDFEITKHEALDLLKKPCDKMTQFQVTKLLSLWYDGIGERLLVKLRDTNGKIVEILPINPQGIVQIGSKDIPWQINTKNGLIMPRNEDVMYDKDIDPWEEWGRGAGAGESLNDELSIAEKTSKSIGIRFDNGMVPPYLITIEGIEDSDLEEARDTWANKFKGFLKRGIPGFFNKKIDVKEMGDNFNDMKLIELRDAQKELIREVFQVPAELMGITGNSNRATITNVWNIYVENVIEPNMKQYCEWLNRDLLSEYNEDIYFDYVSPRLADNDFKLEIIKARPQDFTTDEIRELGGWALLGGEEGNKKYVPFNLVGEQRIVPEKLTLASLNKAFKPRIKANIFAILDAVDEEFILESVKDVYRKAIEEIGTGSVLEISTGSGFNPESSRVNKYIKNNVGENVKYITETMKGKLKSAIQANEAEEGNISTLREKLKDVFEGYKTGYDIERIARTETMQLTNFSTLEGYAQSGIVEQKEWVTSRDDRVRDTHVDMDGVKVGINEDFELPDGKRMPYPSEFNERCTIVAVINGKSLAGTSEPSRKIWWKMKDLEATNYEKTFKQAYVKGFKKIEENVMSKIK